MKMNEVLYQWRKWPKYCNLSKSTLRRLNRSEFKNKLLIRIRFSDLYFGPFGNIREVVEVMRKLYRGFPSSRNKIPCITVEDWVGVNDTGGSENMNKSKK